MVVSLFHSQVVQHMVRLMFSSIVVHDHQLRTEEAGVQCTHCRSGSTGSPVNSNEMCLSVYNICFRDFCFRIYSKLTALRLYKDTASTYSNRLKNAIII